MEKYVVLDKQVGETPLSCAEAWRAEHSQYIGVPLSYAGRLDPMASGKLIVLIGEECKKQTEYHNLDKAYNFSVLFGIESDSLDVLGRLKTTPLNTPVNRCILEDVIRDLVGDIELPYPKFSAKTVQGKPLHMWTLENRLDEISIPTKQSTIYSLELVSTEETDRGEIVRKALEKVNSIPEVTDPRKALGNDFRRADIRADWNNILTDNSLPETYTIAHFSCLASSGTYMRTLATVIASKLNSCGLAWSIKRTHIGTYSPQEAVWSTSY